MQKLLDDAWSGAVLSPGDSQIAFRRGNAIWLADSTGRQARRVLDVPSDYVLAPEMAWSPDGRWIAYGKRRQSDAVFIISTYDLATGQSQAILTDAKIEFFCWLPDGRMIYSRREDPPNDNDSNLWEIRVDPRAARPAGGHRRLTNWGGFLLAYLSASQDGNRLFSIGNRWRSDILVLDLAAIPPVAPRRIATEWLNRPTGWTQDKRALLFDSDRNGTRGVFRQDIDARDSKGLLSGPANARGARLSADGRWILYLSWPAGQGASSGQGRLMRIAAGGGPPETVFPVTGPPIGRASGSPAFEPAHPRFRCPSAGQASCILSEQVGGEVVFTPFDPVNGRKQTLALSNLKTAGLWDLSPDGRWIATGEHGRIRIVPLASQATREIAIGQGLDAIAWAADGKSLFVVTFASQGAPLLRILPDGTTELLYRGSKYLTSPVASPDGRYVAFSDLKVESNGWVIENLP